MTFEAEKILTWLIFLSVFVVGLVYFHAIDIYSLSGATIPHPPGVTYWKNDGSHCLPSKDCFGTIYYKSDASAQDIIDFYSSHLPVDNWQLVANNPCPASFQTNSCGDMVFEGTTVFIKFQIDIPYDNYTDTQKKITIKLK